MAWGEGLVLGLTFAVLLGLGVPVAVCLAMSAAAALLLSVPPEPALITVAQRMATGIDSFSLLAIPFFILAGELMGRGGLARRLIDFARSLVGGLPGGLAFVHVLASMLFGAVSGSAVAAASGVGGVMAPRLEREGYGRGFGAAINITSATTGLVIPPSNILIVYSLASGGVSIAALFLAGYLPGLVLGLCLMGAAWLGVRRGGAPAVGAPRPAGGKILRNLLAAAPSLLLLVVVIGGIVGGVFTATEAAAVAVAYALVLALIYGEVRLGQLPGILRDSATTTAVVMFLIASSMALSWVLAYADLPQRISAGLMGLSSHPVLTLLLLHGLLLMVGTVMDMTPAVLIFTPILLPVAAGLGLHPVHFGMVLVMNLCIGLCTPPVGTVLFVGCGVAKTSLAEVMKPLIPLWLAMIVALMFVTFVPWLSLALPRFFGYLD